MEIKVPYHDELLPELWDDMSLRSKVREALLKIATAFIEFTDLDLKPSNILLIGSSANFNWNVKSDIDLQIIADLSKVATRPEVAKDLLDTKKKVFKRDFNLKVNGRPVEITVSSEPPSVESAYSLTDDKWVMKPKYEKPDVDKDSADIISDKWGKHIKQIVKNPDASWKDMEDIKDQIKDKRAMGLEDEGEYSPENLAYKAIRSAGYVELLKTATKKRMEKELSLREATITANGIFAQALLTDHSHRTLVDRLGTIPRLDYDLHCTIIYSERPISGLELPVIDRKAVYHAMVTQVTYWPGYDKEGFLIAKLKSVDLQIIHDKFRAVGVVPTFEVYQPHITLIHPVADPEVYSAWMKQFNASILMTPLTLELYWGGISLQQ